jgi:nitrogen fixation NifU-like protein
MSELSELYQETILEHNKNPRNFREIEGADNTADGKNPLCGDALRVYVKMEGETVSDVAFKGSGCAISKASASVPNRKDPPKLNRVERPSHFL